MDMVMAESMMMVVMPIMAVIMRVMVMVMIMVALAGVGFTGRMGIGGISMIMP
ncbi:hypothetical protein AA0313_2520 [Acetobacter indonesiensis NRIC 0313]|uniref:Uncharacterized protein n=1 Tax=Acetobacter indonesiensis TaxID=104101 RepID=A0A6N3T0U0_9PROT|nr:hypothetical protein Abin_006_128 [Acetobacter indonesiensis]GBQ60784.1 hypothetical protein AA0313_2520 [Acetobacter indonesiensis NRIC 0313]GEN02105.1 hypothetical protein AIN02nite_01300 [Acetobacter indonesiensis]